MRRLAVVGVVVGLLAVALPGGAQVVFQTALADRTSAEAALAAAMGSGRPALVYIYVSDGPEAELCARMRNTTLADQTVTQASAQFECGELDARDARNRAFLEKYGLGPFRQRGNITDPPLGQIESTVGQAYPAVAFFTPQGEVLHVIVGYWKPEVFATRLTKVAEFEALLRKLQETPNDALAHAQLAHILVAEMERYEQAAPHLQAALDGDPDGGKGARQLALVDDAIVLMAAGKVGEAITLLDSYLHDFPQDVRDRHCEAIYLLGAMKWAQAELAEEEAQTPDAALLRRANGLRRAALEAWTAFEKRQGAPDPPCADSARAATVLGVLPDLREQIAYKDAQLAEVEGGGGDRAIMTWKRFTEQTELDGVPIPDGQWHAAGRYRLGKLLREKGDKGGAKRIWEELDKADPESPAVTSGWVSEARCDLADLLLEEGDKAKAQALWEKVAEDSYATPQATTRARRGLAAAGATTAPSDR